MPVKLYYKFFLQLGIYLPLQKIFFISAFASPESYEEIWVFSDGILGIFNSIPYWPVLIAVLGVGLMIIFGIVILKVFLRT